MKLRQKDLTEIAGILQKPAEERTPQEKLILELTPGIKDGELEKSLEGMTENQDELAQSLKELQSKGIREEYLEGSISPRARRLIRPNKESFTCMEHPSYKWASLLAAGLLAGILLYGGYKTAMAIQEIANYKAEAIEREMNTSIQKTIYEGKKQKNKK